MNPLLGKWKNSHVHNDGVTHYSYLELLSDGEMISYMSCSDDTARYTYTTRGDTLLSFLHPDEFPIPKDTAILVRKDRYSFSENFQNLTLDWLEVFATNHIRNYTRVED